MLRIGHRGAKAYEPENTLRSFGRALKIGVNAVELDVRKTKDNHLIVIHDADINKTTNGKGSVNELTLSEIKGFSTEKGEKIPTLKETLDFIGKKAKILIELKEVGLEREVLKLVHENKLENDVIIVSFLEDALRKVRGLDGAVETGLIYAKHRDPLKAALELKAQYLVGFYRFVHTANVQEAHENGIKVIVWTVNTPEEIDAYVQKGVDGIASDKPDLLMGHGAG
jgi:glycerophosphoryl diester phosphodiesterase